MYIVLATEAGSVCPSVTLWHFMKKKIASIAIPSLWDSPKTEDYIFSRLGSSQNSKVFTHSDGVKRE